MIRFLLVIALATLFAKLGLLLMDKSAWILLPYIAAAFVGGWFLQTDDEKNANLEWIRKRF